MAVDRETEAELLNEARVLLEQCEGDPERLAVMAAQFRRFAQGAKPGEMEIAGGVSSQTGEPFVRFAFGGDFQFQHKPQEARDLAALIWEAAETAVADAAIFAWATEAMEMERTKAGQVVGHVRDFRHDKWGGKGGG